MRITQVDTPDIKAEGLCNGLPYDTDTYSAQGCSIHFWVGDTPKPEALSYALRKARAARDVVVATWSLGQPSGYWAKQDID